MKHTLLLFTRKFAHGHLYDIFVEQNYAQNCNAKVVWASVIGHNALLCIDSYLLTDGTVLFLSHSQTTHKLGSVSWSAG